jgi:organic hydroperoxide reductase OsmC/OhrA
MAAQPQRTRPKQRAHQLCYIANSVNFPVRHEPVTTAA